MGKQLAAGVFSLVLATSPVQAQSFEGMSDCGDWLQARQNKTSVALEHFALGTLNGIAIGRYTEFWRADGREISRAAVYFSIDNYCRIHPTDLLGLAITSLFEQRTGRTAHPPVTERP